MHHLILLQFVHDVLELRHFVGHLEAADVGLQVLDVVVDVRES